MIHQKNENGSVRVNSNVYVDCSKWNVNQVSSHSQFKDDAGGTIIEPKWKS